MIRSLGYYFFTGAITLFFLAIPVSAQELIIDEEGRVFVEWKGTVLGVTTNTSNPLSTPGILGTSGSVGKSEDEDAELDDEDQSETDDDEFEMQEQVTGNGSTIKRVELEDDRLRVKIRPLEDEDESGDEDEASRPAQQVQTIRIREHKSLTDVVIRTSDDGVLVTQGKVRARTNFPISIGPNNELIITTPSGTKTVAILPDAAMKNLLEKGFPIVTTTPESTQEDSSTDSGNINETQDSDETTEVELLVEDGKLVYKAKAKQHSNFLGFVPVVSDVEGVISAETGQMLSYTTPWYMNYFSFLFK